MKIVLSDFLKAEVCFRIKVIKGSKQLPDEQETTYTPNRAALEIFIEAWGDESSEWINKRFEITLVKVNVFGKMKNSIVPKPLNGDEANEKPKVDTVKM